MFSIHEQITVGDLLKRFPDGFAVGPKGEIYQVIKASKRLSELPPKTDMGGFLAVSIPELRPGDERFGYDPDAVKRTASLDEIENDLLRLLNEDKIDAEEAAYDLYEDVYHGD